MSPVEERRFLEWKTRYRRTRAGAQTGDVSAPPDNAQALGVDLAAGAPLAGVAAGGGVSEMETRISPRH